MHVRLWNTATGELVGLLAGPRETIRALAWSPDGKTLATSSGPKVKLWNVATRQELTTFLGSNGVGLARLCARRQPDRGRRHEQDSLVADRARPERHGDEMQVLADGRRLFGTLTDRPADPRLGRDAAAGKASCPDRSPPPHAV